MERYVRIECYCMATLHSRQDLFVHGDVAHNYSDRGSYAV